MTRFAIRMAFLLTVALAVTSPISAHAESVFTYHLATGNFGPGVSYLSSLTKGAHAGQLCSKIGLAPCNASEGNQIDGNMVAPVCSTAATNCISDFYAILDGKKTEAQFLGYVATSKVSLDITHGLLGEGRSDSIWQIPGVTNSGGAETYLLHPVYYVKFENRKFAIQDYAIKITPFTEEEQQGLTDMGVNQDSSTTFVPNGCAFIKKDVCGKVSSFPGGARFGVTLRLQNEVSNWFSGRLSKPTYAVSDFDSRSKNVTIEAEPVDVPLYSASFTEAQATPKIKNFLRKFGTQLKFPGLVGKEADDGEAMASVEAFRELVSNTSSSLQKLWFVSNLRGQNRRCLDSKTEIVGFVSTNAMTFQSEPPIFKGGNLQYQVSGMHFAPDGTTPQLGEYNLTMRSSAAKCLFKLPNVPLSALVSVVNENGVKSYATTVLSESNGWINLAANGFTFSAKTIKIKITKKK